MVFKKLVYRKIVVTYNWDSQNSSFNSRGKAEALGCCPDDSAFTNTCLPLSRRSSHRGCLKSKLLALEVLYTKACRYKCHGRNRRGTGFSTTDSNHEGSGEGVVPQTTSPSPAYNIYDAVIKRKIKLQQQSLYGLAAKEEKKCFLKRIFEHYMIKRRRRSNKLPLAGIYPEFLCSNIFIAWYGTLQGEILFPVGLWSHL